VAGGKNFSRILCILFLMLLCVLLVTGCGMVKNLLSNKDQEKVDKPTVETELNYAPENLDTNSQESMANADTELIEVTLYFASKEGNMLAPEVRTIKKVEGIARATINELISGPGPDSELLPTIPQGTALLDINVKDEGLCIVDFSRELVEKSASGIIPEELTVYSIVNTLTQFPTVNRVRLRIEGQNVESFGAVQVHSPLMENEHLVAKE